MSHCPSVVFDKTVNVIISFLPSVLLHRWLGSRHGVLTADTMFIKQKTAKPLGFLVMILIYITGWVWRISGW